MYGYVSFIEYFDNVFEGVLRLRQFKLEIGLIIGALIYLYLTFIRLKPLCMIKGNLLVIYNGLFKKLVLDLKDIKTIKFHD